MPLDRSRTLSTFLSNNADFVAEAETSDFCFIVLHTSHALLVQFDVGFANMVSKILLGLLS